MTEEQVKARRLYSQGKEIKEINKLTKIPSRTLYAWKADVEQGWEKARRLAQLSPEALGDLLLESYKNRTDSDRPKRSGLSVGGTIVYSYCILYCYKIVDYRYGFYYPLFHNPHTNFLRENISGKKIPLDYAPIKDYAQPPMSFISHFYLFKTKEDAEVYMKNVKHHYKEAYLQDTTRGYKILKCKIKKEDVTATGYSKLVSDNLIDAGKLYFTIIAQQFKFCSTHIKAGLKEWS